MNISYPVQNLVKLRELYATQLSYGVPNTERHVELIANLDDVIANGGDETDDVKLNQRSRDNHYYQFEDQWLAYMLGSYA
jgi:hypothetical protein